MKLFFLILLFCSVTKAQEATTQYNNESLQKINSAYLQKVKPIFKRACFDCHSDQVVYPWYYKIPGIKQWMDSHIEEGREKLEMSKDYPFKGGKKGLKHDLEETWESVDEGEMPPLFYRIMSKERRLSDEDKAIIKGWVDESLKELGN